MRYRSVFPAILIALGLAASARAAEPAITFLSPSNHFARPGETVRVRMTTGASGAALRPADWPKDGVPYFFIRGGATQENKHDVRPAAGESDVAVKAVEPGVTMIGAQLAPVIETYAAADLKKLAESAWNDDAAKSLAPLAANQKLRIRRTQTAVALIRVANADGGVAAVAPAGLSKAGLPVEIRPLIDGTAMAPGADVAFRVYIDGGKVDGAMLRVTSPAGAASKVPADESGAAHFRITDAGVWKVEFNHAAVLTDDPAADWSLHTATLLFESPRGAAR